MRAKKSLGQHFLRSEKALGEIILAGEVGQEDTVLEIGPGRGALTERLLVTGCQLLAVEKDDELYELLRQKFEKEIMRGQLTLIHDDILNFEFKTYHLEPKTYKLIANIPYNITGQILRKFLSAENLPQKMVLLVQKEVAERIARDSKESILSLSVKAYGKPKYVSTVKAGSFHPAPVVDSAILSIDSISRAYFSHISEEEFFRALHAGFRSKRKKLSSNLSEIYPKENLARAFERLDLDPNIRAEDLDLDNWQKLLEFLNKKDEK